MAQQPSSERTEKATPRKRRTARREGRIGNSPEIGSWLGLLAASFIIPRVVHSLMNTATGALIEGGAIVRDPDQATALRVARTASIGAVDALLPLALLM